jgi:hypothetical protein
VFAAEREKKKSESQKNNFIVIIVARGFLPSVSTHRPLFPRQAAATHARQAVRDPP